MNIGISEIWQEDNKTLKIIWTDSKESTYDVCSLRVKCPCASCYKKEKKDFNVDKVRPMNIRSIGKYAIGIEFDDGHKSGIYSYKLLRELTI